MTDHDDIAPAAFPPAPTLGDHQEENAWINSRLREIQEFWHDRFDEDESLRAAGSLRPDPLPDHADDDLRLVHELGAAGAGTRESCFAVLPEGPEMFRRFEHYLSSARSEVSQPEARAMIARMGRLVDGVAPDSDRAWTDITFIDETAPGAWELMESTDGVPYVLEDALRRSGRGRDAASRAATLFLSEPLYLAAGNCYQLHDWVTAAMLDPSLDEIYEVLYRLWRSDWQVFCDPDRVVLVNRGA